MMNWSGMTRQEKIDAMLPYVERGLSQSAIALELGTTKNTVAGMIDRWLSGKKHGDVGSRRRPPTAAGRPVKDHANRGQVLFRDAGPDHCRWIEGNPRAADVLVCGAPTIKGGPWCADHRPRVLVPARKI